ncbi:hypothetical protein [Pseudobutyrivibrio sp.]|uniref:hypothetical protein n=1 Tax=Pseudobutyrivibrio sp. TaxID=2014367 RepID=UPI001DEA157C|nr:hypothetical protein [Pseudobutyrivibrio sp.]MBE5911929.1 hypothetical protein [Pseudobutyrivibrio sp.]
MVNRNRCTQKEIGIVKEKRVKSNHVTIMTVAYLIDGVEYEITERLKYKGEAIKIGPIPIGQRRFPVIGTKKVLDEVDICYNPENPAEAYIVGNDGIWTS